MSNGEIDSDRPEKQPAPLALKIGLCLWAVSLAWWFLYYAQYSGAFSLLDLKLACITGATSECLFFQERMAKTSILPTYVPIFWYAGLVSMVVGIYQSHQAKKATS